MKIKTTYAQNSYSYDIEAVPVDGDYGDDFELDYDIAVDDFLCDNPGVRFVMDNMRGFSNEWALYACADENDVEYAKSMIGDFTEYSSDTVRHWLRSAMMTDLDYKREFGLMKCCILRWIDYIED